MPDSPFWIIILLAFGAAFAIFLLFVVIAGVLIRRLPNREPLAVLRDIYGPQIEVVDFHREGAGFRLSYRWSGWLIALARRQGGVWDAFIEPPANIPRESRQVTEALSSMPAGGLAGRLRHLRNRLRPA